jgi:hypothetical protein
MADPVSSGLFYLGARGAEKKVKKALTPMTLLFPTEDTSQVQEAAANERRRRLGAAGYRSTILSRLLPGGLKTKFGE